MEQRVCSETDSSLATQETPHILCNPKVQNRSHNSPPNVRIMGQTIKINVLKALFNIIPQYTPKYSAVTSFLVPRSIRNAVLKNLVLLLVLTFMDIAFLVVPGILDIVFWVLPGIFLDVPTRKHKIRQSKLSVLSQNPNLALPSALLWATFMAQTM